MRAILLLIVRDMVGSAFALVRSVFEGTCSAGYGSIAARLMPKSNEYKMKDDIRLDMAEIADAIDTACGTQGF